MSEIKRLTADLEHDDQLYQGLTEFEGTPDELIGWLNDRGYQLAAAELAGITSTYGGRLSDETLEGVAGGMTSDGSEGMSLKLQLAMDRRSKAMQTLSNIMSKFSQTQDAIISNLK